MKFPFDDHSLCFVDTIDTCMQDTFDMSCVDDLQVALEAPIEEISLNYVLSTNL